MKTNSFNICPTCVHKATCILTEHKSHVWSCSEYDEVLEDKNKKEITSEIEYEFAVY